MTGVFALIFASFKKGIGEKRKGMQEMLALCEATGYTGSREESTNMSRDHEKGKNAPLKSRRRTNFYKGCIHDDILNSQSNAR
jgi:hypothetical protein